MGVAAPGPEVHVDSDALRAVARRYDLRLVVLFGSHAKGRALPRSDVDVAVLARKRPWGDLDWELDLEADLCSAFPGREVDLALLNGASPLLAFEVASSGRPLFEEDSMTFSGFRSHAARAFYDDEPRMRRQAQYVSELHR
jgi:uncharacterized protein